MTPLWISAGRTCTLEAGEDVPESSVQVLIGNYRGITGNYRVFTGNCRVIAETS